MPIEEFIACSDCGLVQLLPALARNDIAECVRCGHRLARYGAGAEVPLAFALSALLLLIPAALTPLLRLTSFGIVRLDWLPTGVEALWNGGYRPLASLIFLFSIAIPFGYLGLVVGVLGALRLGIKAPLGRWFRWSLSLRPWAMVEVYLVGCCVAYSRLEDLGTIDVGIGGWCFMAAALGTLLSVLCLDDRSIWSALAPQRALDHNPLEPSAHASERLIDCGSCGLVLEETNERSPCPRCGALLRRRKPDAVQRTVALVIAGFILYLPANVFPVLSVERFGHDQPNTILSGVRQLVAADLWPLAVVVFTASILVPLLKLFGLCLMLWLTHRRSSLWLVGRTRLYRVIDLIGRWSSIDLFMISILVAIVRFGSLTSVRAEAGATAFAAVVVITMFASRSFDPRVMWDAAESRS
jgi:paraquat-inducible protein A